MSEETSVFLADPLLEGFQGCEYADSENPLYGSAWPAEAFADPLLVLKTHPHSAASILRMLRRPEAAEAEVEEERALLL